jgi:hypothetical protein
MSRAAPSRPGRVVEVGDLDHVTQRAGFFIVARPGSDSFRLTHGNLDVVDVFVVPDGLENAVGEAHDHEILDRFLAQIMIDAKNLRFVEDPSRHRVDRLRRGQIAPDRLFDDDPCVGRAGAWSSGESGAGQALADGSEGTGRDAEIENAISRQLERMFEFLHARFELPVGLGVIVLAG